MISSITGSRHSRLSTFPDGRVVDSPIFFVPTDMHLSVVINFAYYFEWFPCSGHHLKHCLAVGMTSLPFQNPRDFATALRQGRAL